MKQSHLVLFIFLAPSLSSPASSGGDILDFNVLPDCALACKDLYSAQYECQRAPSASELQTCFCKSKFTHRGENKGWGCDSVCGKKEQKERVMRWLDKFCEAEEKRPAMVDKPEGRVKAGDQTPPVSTDPNKKKGTETHPETGEAVSWWRRNWPYFLLAFLLITIPILLFAFAIPVRKYVKRQIIRRRVRRTGLHDVAHWTPPPTAPIFAQPFLGVGIPGAARREDYYRSPQVYEGRRDYSGGSSAGGLYDGRGYRSSSLGSGQYYANGGLHDTEPGSHYDSGGLGSHSEVGTPADGYVSGGQWRGSEYEGDGPPKPSSVRQESWEQRLRKQFTSPQNGGGEGLVAKLAFWRRGGRREEECGYANVRSNHGSTVGVAL